MTSSKYALEHLSIIGISLKDSERKNQYLQTPVTKVSHIGLSPVCQHLSAEAAGKKQGLVLYVLLYCLIY